MSRHRKNPPSCFLVGGWALPLWKMMEWVTVGMMIFPIWWESHKIPWFQTTNQIHDSRDWHYKNSFKTIPSMFHSFSRLTFGPAADGNPCLASAAPPWCVWFHRWALAARCVATRLPHPARPWAPDPSGPCSRPWEVTLVQEIPGLVNIEKTMEKRHFSWVNQLFRLGHFQ